MSDEGEESGEQIAAIAGQGRKSLPMQPLQVFDAQNPNGTWLLHASDVAINDAGQLRHFALDIAHEVRSRGFAGSPQLFLSGFE